MWSSLTNATATIYTEVVVGSIDDGMGGTIDQLEMQPIHEEVVVGFDPGTTFEWAVPEGESASHAGALYVPPAAAADVTAGDRVDVTYRGETVAYRVESVRVLEGPTGAHGEAAVVSADDEVGVS